MTNSSKNYAFTGDYTVLWVHPKMPSNDIWMDTHDFDMQLRNILIATAGQKDTDVFDFDVNIVPKSETTIKKVVSKIKTLRPNLIMFFDEFAQWNVILLHAIRKDKEITKNSYQILSYPTLLLVLSNFNE